MTSKSHVIVIAGPNGAGKSTIAPALLRDALQVTEFVNADAIAQGLSAFAPEKMAIKAGRVMLNRLHNLAEQKVNFAFETTLASRSFAPWLKEICKNNYLFHLIFLWLPSVELCIKRVEDRVNMGGHDIPIDTIKRRYFVGLNNLFNVYQPIANSWQIYDNSNAENLFLVAEKQKQAEMQIFDNERWLLIKSKTNEKIK